MSRGNEITQDDVPRVCISSLIFNDLFGNFYVFLRHLEVTKVHPREPQFQTILVRPRDSNELQPLPALSGGLLFRIAINSEIDNQGPRDTDCLIYMSRHEPLLCITLPIHIQVRPSQTVSSIYAQAAPFPAPGFSKPL